MFIFYSYMYFVSTLPLKSQSTPFYVSTYPGRRPGLIIVPRAYIQTQVKPHKDLLLFLGGHDGNHPVYKTKTITKPFQRIRSFKIYSIVTLELRRIS